MPAAAAAAAIALSVLGLLSLGGCGSDSPAPAVGSTSGALPASTLPPPPPVMASDASEAPTDELAQKRTEWAEVERQASERELAFQEWRRTRRERERVKVAQLSSSAEVQSEGTRLDMVRWHRYYARRAAFTALALSRFDVAAGNTSDPRRLFAVCTDLKDATDDLIADHLALKAPVPAVAEPLGNAYAQLRAMAASCLEHRDDQRLAHLNAANTAMSAAATAMRPFNLTP